jgi:hypothetical protein
MNIKTPPVPVRVLPTTVASGPRSELDEIIQARRTRAKPSNLDDYAWSLAEEMRRNGGLFDLSVQIARLESHYAEIERLVEQNDILRSTALTLQIRLTTQIADLKAKAVDVAAKTRTIITLDGMQVVMQALLASLQTHIHDPHLLEKIGRDVTDAVRAALASVRQK